MADKTPLRVVFDSSNVATGIGEMQSGETVGTAHGGTGLSAIGTAGQVLKVNAAGTALEFGAEGDISITNLVAPTNSDLTLTTSGTGNIILDAITVRGTTISSADSSIININEGVVVDGTLNTSGQATLSGLAYPTSDGTIGQFLKTDGSGTLSFADLSLGDLTIIGSTISVPSNADFTLDPSGTGAIKLNANTDITGNLTVTGTLDLGDSNFTNVGSLQLDSIAGDGDTNTSITFSGSDVITIATGGSGRLTVGDGALSPVTDSQIDLGTSSLYYKDAYIDSITTTGNVSIGGNLDVTGTLDLSDSNFTNVGSLQLDSIAGDGDTNTSITFSGSDVITVATGGSTALTVNADQSVTLNSTNKLNFNDAGTHIFSNADGDLDIVSDGTNNDSIKITSAGGVTIDANNASATGVINLDSNYHGYIGLKDNGTTYGTFTNLNASNLNITASISDADMIFRGNDGGSTITALTLDMSEAGAATFNSTVTASGFTGDVTGDVTGNTDTATTLATARTIAGQSFNGSANITIASTDLSNTSNIALLDATQTLTNKTITSPTIATPTVTGTLTATSVTTNDIVSNGSNADITIDPTGTGDINLTAGADVNIPANIGLTFGDDGEKIEGDGTDLTIASSNDILLDSADNIILDSDTGTLLRDNGTHFATFSSSNGLSLTCNTSNGDVLLRGNDGGSYITALTLDISEAGAATFNSTVTVGGAMTATSVTANDFTSNGSNADITIAPQGTGDINLTAGADVNIPANVGLTFGDDGEKIEGTGTNLTITSSSACTVSTGANFVVDSGGDIKLDFGGGNLFFRDDGTDILQLTNSGGGNAFFTVKTQDKDFVIKGDDGGATITALTLDMSAAGAATFNSTIATTGITVNSAYTLPTADGSNGNALVTDGSGTLSFGTVGDPAASDLTDAVARKDKRLYLNRPRTIDKFDLTWQDSVLYYVCTNDYKNDIANIQKISVVHNDSEAFISAVGINNSDSLPFPVFTADVSGSLVLIKGEMTSADSSIDAIGGSTTFLKIGLGDNSANTTSGNTQLIVNADVDSASEAFDTVAHATYRGAKYFFSVNNASKTEVENFEVMVVHDGTDAYLVQYGGVSTGNDTLLTVSAAISGSNLVVSVASFEPNTRVTANIIRLKDTMVSDAGTYGNTEAIAPTTISSTATAIVDLDTTTKGNGALVYVVGKNAGEGAFSISEVFVAVGGDGDISLASMGHVSTKNTDQLEFTAGFKDDEEATAQLLASSTSGASTTCSAYRVNLLAN